MIYSKITNEGLYIGISCLAAIIVLLPIVVFGIPSGNDLPQHYQFAQTYYNSLINGDGFPSWSDKENYGYGSIGIRFYPPLAYYILSFARMLAGNWFDASWLTFMFWMALGCCGVYFWSRWWLSPKISAVAAIIYALIPYHLSQIYSFSFFYADFAGSAVLPFCFAFLTRVLEREKKSDLLGFSIAYAALVLTHLPTTIIGSLSIAVYALFFLQKGKLFRQIVKSSVGVFFGLLASAYFWFPLVTEMSWLNHATDRYNTGHYSFANRFFPLYLHATSNDNPNSFILSDVMIILCVLFLTSAVVYIFYRKTETAEAGRESCIYRKVLPLGLFAVLMLTPLSYPLWKILTPLQKTQFPLRWMGVVSMCGAVVLASSIHFLLKGNLLKQRSWSYIAVSFACIIFLFNCIYVWDPGASVPIAKEKFESDMQKLPEEQNQVFWWSVWSDKKAIFIKEKVLIENRELTVQNWSSEQRNFQINSGMATQARIATFYYPHWKAEVNGNPVNVEKDENGAILIPIPAEASTVKVYFQEPFGVRTASIVSIIAWLILGVSGLFITANALYFSRRTFQPLPEPHTVN
jgi:uncharacterized membrane protein